LNALSPHLNLDPTNRQPPRTHLQVPRLRAERRSLQPDPRFMQVVQLVRSGMFGWEDYFAPVMDAITTGEHPAAAVWRRCGAGGLCCRGGKEWITHH